jgi:nucleoside-diphosphate-sugar epimerase
MRVVVTGVAGFIGSHLTERLLETGHDVIGIDSLTPYYAPAQKRENLPAPGPSFEYVEADLCSVDLRKLLDGAEVVFHIAGQPGVRPSWTEGFGDYLHDNVLATQRLLDAARQSDALQRFVYASSSSVYGNAARYPCHEEDRPTPHSPYGVTKLAGEHLCNLYAANWRLPTISLRLFTVYGPRQRPDMAMHRLCRAAVTGDPFPLYGDGRAERDFTFVSDVVRAFEAAATAPVEPGTVVNVTGSHPVRLREVIELVGDLAGRTVTLDRLPPQPGDVDRTGGSSELIQRVLGWKAEVPLERGLAAQLGWHRQVLSLPV